MCLLSKWLFNLLNEDGIWQRLIRKKYLGDKTLSQVSKKAGDSHFWSGLMEVKDLFLSLGVFKVHSGDQTRFWKGLWLGNKTLKDECPELYRITRRKNVTVASVLNSRPLNISFRRALLGNNLTQWLQLVSKVVDVALNNEKDVFVWSPNKNGLFTVKSMYSNMMTNEAYPAFCRS